MGKIFNALEKSHRERENTARVPRGSAADYYDSGGKRSAKGELMAPLNVSSSVDPNLITWVRPRSIEAEMFKILRSNILFPAKGKPPRSIMITSAVPAEGKSFVAANLAVSIAQNINEHVLLMDCDMRKPSIHTMFGFSGVPGLAEYLGGDQELARLFLKSGVDKLTLLPGGDPPPNPAELLSSKKMNALLEEVKTRYSDRYVIIDSPPPQLTAETSAMARQVDGVILVIRAGHTPRDMVAELIDIIDRQKIIGCVLNWFDLQTSSYYGYGKYGKYGQYYHRKKAAS